MTCISFNWIGLFIPDIKMVVIKSPEDGLVVPNIREDEIKTNNVVATPSNNDSERSQVCK